jgi:hypothetical protein
VYKWSVSYPRGWKVDAANPHSVIFRGERPPGVLGIHALPDAQSKSLDEAVTHVLQFYPPARFATVSRRAITLPNGVPAIEVVHHIGSGVVGKSRKLIMVAKGRGFLIDAETYLNSWDAAEPYFNRMIDSFSVQE